MIMEQFKDGSQSLQRIWAVGLRLIRQIKRDRRTIATVIINPIILMLIMGYSLSLTLTGINLGIVEPQNGATQGSIQGSILAYLQASDSFSIVYIASESEARRLMTEGRLNGAVVLDGAEIKLLLDGTNPQVTSTITGNVAAGIQAGASQILASLSVPNQIPTVTTYYVYGYDIEAKDAIGAAYLGSLSSFLLS